MDCNPPGSSVYGILQARILEWVAISFSRGSFRPRNRTRVSCIAGRWFTDWAMREAQGPPELYTRTVVWGGRLGASYFDLVFRLIWGGWEQDAFENSEKPDVPLSFLCHCQLRHHPPFPNPTRHQGQSTLHQRSLSSPLLLVITTNEGSLHWSPWLQPPSVTFPSPSPYMPFSASRMVFLKCWIDPPHLISNEIQTSGQPLYIACEPLEETSLFSFHVCISFFSPPRYILTGALWLSSQISLPLTSTFSIPIPPCATPGPALLRFLWDENPLDVLHLHFPPLTEFSGKQGPHLPDSQICILGPGIWHVAGGVVIKA